MGIFSSKFELVNSDSQSWSIFKGKDVSLTNHDFWPKFSEGYKSIISFSYVSVCETFLMLTFAILSLSDCWTL